MKRNLPHTFIMFSMPGIQVAKKVEFAIVRLTIYAHNSNSVVVITKNDIQQFETEKMNKYQILFGKLEELCEQGWEVYNSVEANLEGLDSITYFLKRSNA